MCDSLMEADLELRNLGRDLTAARYKATEGREAQTDDAPEDASTLGQVAGAESNLSPPESHFCRELVTRMYI